MNIIGHKWNKWFVDDTAEKTEDMGWGTLFNTEVYISRKILETRSDAEAQLDECTSQMDYVTKNLIAMSAIPPQIVADSSSADLANDIVRAVEELLEMYKDAVEIKTKTYLFLNYLDGKKDEVEI